MPPLTRWSVRAALLWLIIALAGAAVVAGRPVLGLPVATALLGPVAVHAFVVGWITQMIFGVAHWMFPRYSAAAPRGKVGLGIIAFVLLNGGLGLRAVAEPWHGWHAGTWEGPALVIAAVAQLLAGVLFTLHLWPRVKER